MLINLGILDAADARIQDPMTVATIARSHEMAFARGRGAAGANIDA
ncbi:hypothetical protein AB0B31_27795 [Catellatospora citrea]